MNTSAYLVRQGWRGDGHSLDGKGRGIKKPLLVSRKQNSFGVGKKKNDVHADQWWSRAFDSGLKNLDIGQVKPLSESKQISSLDLLRKTGTAGSAKWGGLYDGFTKGETLAGTAAVSSRNDLEDSGIVEDNRLLAKKRTKKRKNHELVNFHVTTGAALNGEADLPETSGIQNEDVAEGAQDLVLADVDGRLKAPADVSAPEKKKKKRKKEKRKKTEDQ